MITLNTRSVAKSHGNQELKKRTSDSNALHKGRDKATIGTTR
ncbi:hypothetical protein ADIARSV_0947 [Arcticibacter svalbardensis MN12-7]|uniref:Uncharacterized protein n=1 Tax=Arcticibacter svalbardensis MN12-7 TaxID=1150600 RepID=R9GWH5_9SPHI|nr:hypothetical protein ADIARSV_0947 [Arcticibacter svalbardensis MN12-7]